jgi:1,4-alpha-glucan branching enzyme
MKGYLSLILTGHVPYLRAAGREPDGEDALHETIAQSIVPMLNVIFDLREQGVRPSLALAYSPVLIEQLSDNIVQKHFVVWMEQWLARIEQELVRWEAAGQAHHAYLARFYLDWGQGTLRSFVERFGRNLVSALRELCDDGILEPLAGPATHAYLPLLGRPESIQAQMNVGLFSCTRRLGRRPRGLWLPECGYHPSIEPHLAGSGARYVIVDPASLPSAAITHLRPRWVRPRRLALFARDEPAAGQIWSPDLGYLGDPLYRAPQRDTRSGLALWHAGDGSAALYDPYDAFQRAQAHAAHWSAYVTAELEAFRTQHDRPGIAVVPLDAELLGRRWFEGPAWLRALIEAFADHPWIALTAPSAYLRAYRPRQGVTPREGSWGLAGDHRAWDGRAAQPLWQALSESEERLVQLTRRYPHARGERERALAQAVRELMLAQSSDWPLLLNQGTAGDEAWSRPAQHLHRCERLCALAEQEAINDQERAFLEHVEELDNPFPNLNYRVFAKG